MEAQASIGLGLWMTLMSRVTLPITVEMQQEWEMNLCHLSHWDVGVVCHASIALLAQESSNGRWSIQSWWCQCYQLKKPWPWLIFSNFSSFPLELWSWLCELIPFQYLTNEPFFCIRHSGQVSLACSPKPCLILILFHSTGISWTQGSHHCPNSRQV